MHLIKKMMVILFMAIIILSGIPQTSLATNYVTASKTVNPSSITTEQEAEVTLRITGSPPVNVVKPNDVVLIIDRSGSMTQENKMSAAKEAAKEFIDLIDFSKHRVGIVDFSSDAKQLDLTTDGAAAKAYIDTLNASGATATGDAIDKAKELLVNHRPDAQPVIIIMTDGDATVPQGSAYDYALQKANEAKEEGIVFYTIALLLSTDNADTSGPNLLLKKMATTSHHHHFVLGSAGLDEIYEAIVEEIGLASAYDVVVTDTVAPEFEIVPGSYQHNIPEPVVNGNTLTWDFLELKNETLSFTYKIRHKQGAPIGTLRVANDTRVTYKDYTGIGRAYYMDNPSIQVRYPAPVILSIINESGSIAGGEVVKITGNHFRPGVAVKFGNTPSSNVVYVSKQELQVTVPPGSQGPASVTVTNVDGQFATSEYHYKADPQVTSITPTNGPLAGGNTVAITGNYFMPGVKVKFGENYSTGITYSNSQYIKAVVPAGVQPGTVDVLIENTDSTSTTVVNAYSYDEPVVIVPEIKSISPNSGLVTGGDTVYIDGSKFASGAKVYFGAIEAPVSFYSEVRLKVNSPAVSQAGPVDVTVINPDGKSATVPGGFTYNDLPPKPAFQITKVSPNSGLVDGGEIIIIDGVQLVPGIKVFFGSLETPVDYFFSDTKIKVKAPKATAPGVVDVTVTNPNGESSTLPAAYTYTLPAPKPAPEITTITPNSGLVDGGEVIIIDGKNLVSGIKVFFGSVETPVDYFFSDTKIKVKAPKAAAPGVVDVTITNSDGQSSTLPGAYKYTLPTPKPAPVITAITPNKGTTSGGTVVIIDGDNFQPGATVSFGTKQVPLDYFFDAKKVRVKTPVWSGAAGPVDVTITNPDGQSATVTQGFTFESPVPIITSLSPNTGPITGGTVVIVTGEYFDTNLVLKVDGKIVPVDIYFSNKQFRFKTPSTTVQGPVTVEVTNPSGLSATTTFTYTPPVLGPAPSITSLSPTSGPISGGTMLVIYGSNFDTTSAKVSINGVLYAPNYIFNANTLRVRTPAVGTPGIVYVKVVNPDGQESNVLQFEYK